MRDEETWKKLIHGVDAFLGSIPDHLQEVYKAKTPELMKPTMLSCTKNDGTVIGYCPELFFYGVKRE